MTVEGFLGELKDHAPRAAWSEFVCIRAECDGRRFCPVTFVLYATVGKALKPEKFGTAGSMLGLSEEDTLALASSADGTFPGSQKTKDLIREAVGL